MDLSLEQLNPLLLNAGLAVHNADWNWKNVRSPFARMYYVTKGTAKVSYGAFTQELRPGHIYLILPNMTHSYVCDTHFEHIYLHIYEDYNIGSSWMENWNLPMEIAETEGDEALFRRLCNINPHTKLSKSDPESYDNESTLRHNIQRTMHADICDKVETRGIIQILLSRFLRHATRREIFADKRIVKTVQYINEHIDEDMQADELAAVAFLSKDHFIRLFRKTVGMTPIQYVIKAKMERAQLLLLTTGLPVKTIACRLSYYDYSYFNRIFRRQTGMTPLEYRKSYK